MGVENENVVNGIAKLQQLMAFTQGISALKDLGTGLKGLSAAVNLTSKSFKGLKGAIASTGIGALLVVLGLVIENWDKIIAKVNEFIDVAKISEKVTAGMAAAWEGMKQSIVAIGNAITTYITAPFKTITAAISAFSETEGDVLDKLKAAMKASKSEIVDAGKNIVNGFKEVGVKAANAYNNSIDEQNKKAAKKREAARNEELKKAAEHSEKLLKIREEQLKREELTEKQKAEKILEIEEDRLKNTKILYGEDSLEYET